MLVFWACVAFLLYVYGGFSALLAVAGRIANRQVRKADITPRVSLIVAAYNEEAHIAARIENAVSLDYPNLEILIASDGSTDRTNAIAEAAERRKNVVPGVSPGLPDNTNMSAAGAEDSLESVAPTGLIEGGRKTPGSRPGLHPFAAPRLRLLKLPRRGKLNALNAAVAEASGEILVFSDANSLFARDAIRRIVANFADPEVGGVAGRTSYILQKGSDSSSDGENLYWSFDSWLKEMESRTGSIVSAHGGIYAIRRALYDSTGASACTDDFAISTAVIAKGYRLVYESQAVSHEDAAPRAEREFRRKTRLMTRGLQGVVLRRALLNPFKYGFYSLILLSHKVLRRLVPVILAPLLVSSIVLAPTNWLYAAAALGQITFYGLAAAGYSLRRHRIGRLKPLYIPFFYCMANAAALIAVINLIRGRRIELWQPQREAL